MRVEKSNEESEDPLLIDWRQEQAIEFVGKRDMYISTGQTKALATLWVTINYMMRYWRIGRDAWRGSPSSEIKLKAT